MAVVMNPLLNVLHALKLKLPVPDLSALDALPLSAEVKGSIAQTIVSNVQNTRQNIGRLILSNFWTLDDARARMTHEWEYSKDSYNRTPDKLWVQIHRTDGTQLAKLQLYLWEDQILVSWFYLYPEGTEAQRMKGLGNALMRRGFEILVAESPKRLFPSMTVWLRAMPGETYKGPINEPTDEQMAGAFGFLQRFDKSFRKLLAANAFMPDGSPSPDPAARALVRQQLIEADQSQRLSSYYNRAYGFERINSSLDTTHETRMRTTLRVVLGKLGIPEPHWTTQQKRKRSRLGLIDDEGDVVDYWR